MLKRIVIPVILLMMSLQFSGMAQELTCAEKLSESRRRFEQGRFYSIPELLEACVKSGFNDQQKIEALFLLSQTYLFIDEPAKAEAAYLTILGIDPEFKPDEERSPIDQVYLSEKFTTRPIFILNSQIGANYSSVDVIEEFTTSDLPLYTDYKLGVGFQWSFGVDFVFSDFVSISTELGVIQKKYTVSEEQVFEDDERKMTESLWNIEVPVLVRFRWDAGFITPYIYGGPAINYAIGSNANVTFIDNRTEVSGTESSVVYDGKVNMMDQREKLTYAVLVGGGIRIKTGYNFLSVDLRYRNGLNNIVDKDGQYQNFDLVFGPGFVDDYKRINNLAISVGFVKPFYKPRKKKKYR